MRQSEISVLYCTKIVHIRTNGTFKITRIVIGSDYNFLTFDEVIV